MRAIVTVWIGSILVAADLGCLQHAKPVVPPPEMTPAERNFEALWAASQNVLRRYGFVLDRVDRRDGVITTEAMVGQYVGESWRQDAATPRDLLEGSVQTLFRSAEVLVTPAAEAGTFGLEVRTAIARQNLATVQVTSASDAKNMLRAMSTRQRYAPRDELTGQPGGQVELGRDVNLEAKIERAIRAEAARLSGGR